MSNYNISLSPPDEATARAQAQMQPLGEVHVRLFGWEKGAAEVRVAFPDNAKPGVPGAPAVQARFLDRVTAEITDAVRILGGGSD